VHLYREYHYSQVRPFIVVLLYVLQVR